jgi:hypothetical protein
MNKMQATDRPKIVAKTKVSCERKVKSLLTGCLLSLESGCSEEPSFGSGRVSAGHRVRAANTTQIGGARSALRPDPLEAWAVPVIALLPDRI